MHKRGRMIRGVLLLEYDWLMKGYLFLYLILAVDESTPWYLFRTEQ